MIDSDTTDALSPQDSAEEGGSTPRHSEEESTGDPWLDELLSEGILKGHARLGLAQTCLAAFVIVAVGWMTFSGTASSPFLLGDLEPLVEQEALHHAATISRVWDGEIGPISAFTYSVNWLMGDSSAFPFQITQIFIHLMNALLVFLLCRSLVRGGNTEAIPMAAGLVFAVHPLSTYAVNTLTDRDLLLGTFFMLLSLVLYLSAIRGERVGWMRVALSLIFFGLAWVCGAWTLVVPLLVLLITLAVKDWSGLRKHALCVGVYFPVAALLLFQATMLSDSTIAGDALFRDASHLEDYALAWLLPGAEPWVYMPESGAAGFPLFLAVLLVVGIVAVFKFPRMALLVLWPACIVVGTGLGLASAGFENTHIYPAGIGFALAVSMIVDAIPKGVWRNVSGIGAALSVFVCLGISHARNMDWKDEIYFWSRASEDCPDCFEPNFRSGQAYQAEGDRLARSQPGEDADAARIDRAKQSWKTAEGFYRVAEKSGGDIALFGSSYARVQHSLGKIDEAIETMGRVVASDPDDLGAIRASAKWHGERFSTGGNPEDLRAAVTYFETLELLEAITDSDRLDWATNLYQLGSYSSAGTQLKRLEDRAVQAEAAALLRQLSPRLNSMAAQQKAFDEAMAKQAALPEVIRMRVEQDVTEGRIINARYLNEELIRLTGNEHAEDWFSLARTSFAIGEWEVFVGHWAPPAGIESPWQALAEQSASEKQWPVALQALMQRPQFDGSLSRAEALLTLADIALGQNDLVQADGLYRQMARENPNRFEPWLGLADMAIDVNKLEYAREMLRQAESRGASQAAIDMRRNRAGIERSPVDLLEPTRIQ